jgi:two-component system, NtrC family, sensor histidine kinase PilS
MYHERRLRLFIFVRIFVTFLFLISTIVLDVKDFMAISELSSAGIVRLMAFSFVFSIASYLFSRFPRYQNFIGYLQTIWDLLFVTLLLIFTGGVQSPFSFLYLLSIMNAGVLMGRREALYTASLCGILYGSIVDMQYFGLLGIIGLTSEAALNVGAANIIYNIFLNLMAFYLTAFITGHLYRIAQENEDALKRKTVNYDELDRLNKTIVSNLESGLITLTVDGKIRVFNRYAEQLSGRKQEHVYDSHISAVFPVVAEALEKQGHTAKCEFSYTNDSGDELVLGFGTSPFFGPQGEMAGFILSFKDLTALNQMKDALKRKDRLAALGELSARMAHEIRNPLTAMSGAVQLLSEHGTLAGSDKRLLTIILRESDRLNKLISEFLAYARPPQPDKTVIDLYKLIDDMVLLLATDSKFHGVKVVNQVPQNIRILADENQIKQVLINLLYNSVEASGSIISVDAFVNKVQIDSQNTSEFTVIAVSDNGTGVPDEIVRNIFEPFWTTKPEGTGLGLAIIYRIIEGHSGRIIIESPSCGGCKIKIFLPSRI